jgi:hypothetical protein
VDVRAPLLCMDLLRILETRSLPTNIGESIGSVFHERLIAKMVGEGHMEYVGESKEVVALAQEAEEGGESGAGCEREPKPSDMADGEEGEEGVSVGSCSSSCPPPPPAP